MELVNERRQIFGETCTTKPKFSIVPRYGCVRLADARIRRDHFCNIAVRNVVGFTQPVHLVTKGDLGGEETVAEILDGLCFLGRGETDRIVMNLVVELRMVNDMGHEGLEFVGVLTGFVDPDNPIGTVFEIVEPILFRQEFRHEMRFQKVGRSDGNGGSDDDVFGTTSLKIVDDAFHNVEMTRSVLAHGCGDAYKHNMTIVDVLHANLGRRTKMRLQVVYMDFRGGATEPRRRLPNKSSPNDTDAEGRRAHSLVAMYQKDAVMAHNEFLFLFNDMRLIFLRRDFESMNSETTNTTTPTPAQGMRYAVTEKGYREFVESEFPSTIQNFVNFQAPMTVLDVEPSEGLTSCLFSDLCMSHIDSKLVSVGTFPATDDCPDAEKTFLRNILRSLSPQKVQFYNMDLAEFFRLNQFMYDIVFVRIEGDVQKSGWLLDRAYAVLKMNGLLWIHGYMLTASNEEGESTTVPSKIVDAFIEQHEKEVTIVHRAKDVALIKSQVTISDATENKASPSEAPAYTVGKPN